jgi:hypothetical protein
MLRYLALLAVVPAPSCWATYIITDLSLQGVGENRPGSAWVFSHVFDINDDGIVVGEWQDNAFAFDIGMGAFIGSLFNGGRFTTSSNSYATGVNNAGQIIGFADAFPDNTFGSHNYVYNYLTDQYSAIDATIYPWSHFGYDITEAGIPTLQRTPYSGPLDLLSLLEPGHEWASITPVAINSRGVIIADGILAAPPPVGLNEPRNHSLVLRPVNVPEPSTLLLLSSGLGAALLTRRRRVTSRKLGRVHG